MAIHLGPFAPPVNGGAKLEVEKRRWKVSKCKQAPNLKMTCDKFMKTDAAPAFALLRCWRLPESPAVVKPSSKRHRVHVE
jgi:hypothetical protein